MSERLDEERLEILRKWGVGLSTDGREELRAAGKAITILVDEIDRLQVEVWHARADAASAGAPATGRAGRAGRGRRDRSSRTTLRDRLGAVLPSLSTKNDT